MALNWSKAVYAHAQDTFGRPVTFMPIASQPGQLGYSGRGIYDTEPIDVMTEDVSSFSDTRTVLDILEEEFAVLPAQGDTLTIPAYLDLIAIGSFEIIESRSNGGGETSLSLRRLLVSKP